MQSIYYMLHAMPLGIEVSHASLQMVRSPGPFHACPKLCDKRISVRQTSLHHTSSPPMHTLYRIFNAAAMFSENPR
jgi:hypothetical protein